MSMSVIENVSKRTELLLPYSKFPVGAALLTADDTVIVGANCENASYGGTICAERNAVTTALSRGFRQFKTIAVGEKIQDWTSLGKNHSLQFNWERSSTAISGLKEELLNQHSTSLKMKWKSSSSNRSHT
uniref:CMP/dCMP-type deaminase domain-containing protein n=1 Tax=Angiostrongylus cantonensis TaxID=6313 RepID=A0A0K0D4J3_ANGCA